MSKQTFLGKVPVRDKIVLPKGSFASVAVTSLSSRENLLRGLRNMDSSTLHRSYCPYDPSFVYTGKYYGEQMLYQMAFGRLKPPEVRKGHGDFYIKPQDYGFDFSFAKHDIEVKVIDASTGNLYFDFSPKQVAKASCFAIYNTQDKTVKFSHSLFLQTYSIPPKHYLLVARK